MPHHQTFIDRCLRNHYINSGGKPTLSQLKNSNFLHPQAVKLKLVAILSMTSWEFLSVHVHEEVLMTSKSTTSPYLYHYSFIKRCFRNHYIKFGWELPSQELKNDISLSCQTCGHIINDIIIWNTPLNYNFFTQ